MGKEKKETTESTEGNSVFSKRIFFKTHKQFETTQRGENKSI
jgi:hypothetical protein